MGVNNFTLLGLEPQAAGLYTDTQLSTGYEIHLYKNDVTTADGIVIGDLTEADFPGYAQQLLDPMNWIPYNPVEYHYEIDYGIPVEFVAAGTGFSSQTVYGFYLCNSFGDLLMAERFDLPRNVTPGATLAVTPRLRVRSRQY